MSREGAEYALRARAEERDRISGHLLDLESHTTYQLLKGAPLRGLTQRRWGAGQAALTALWTLYDAYRGVLRDAEQIRASRGRLGSEQLAVLTGLLAGPSVVLKAAVKPVEQRSLLPEQDERLSLDEAVARMDASFQEVTDVLADIDAVWSAALPRLDAADALLREVTALRRELDAPESGGPAQADAPEPADVAGTPEAAGVAKAPETAGVAGELRRLRTSVLEDPLGAPPSPQDLDRIDRLLAAHRTDLEEALRARREYGRRREDLAAALDRVRAAESEARLAHGAVVVKIALPASAVPRSRVDPLSDELALLDASADDWLARARRLAALEQAARQAADQARATAAAMYGLLGRRDELRGRLGACQAKAVRSGTAEDPEAIRLYERARLLLWTAPCDLTKAAEAVDLYQRAIHGGGR
ncbi:hypothetical protein HTZ77_09640 [Nonomuraea sp. SMC257]|uniref:Uncharacterized protein n=1 Tax=Nonomuraea montanisoli TaxID=2741721 RepID=A0A7Y6I5T2_9ACTN|nr:hypothetical protein [Nonomuraea montanisoli]NUW31688.1 hypothetical protein [Nonomuraea montanisoli]